MLRSYSRFEIPGVLRFEEGRGGLARAVVSSEEADAELYLQGAHLTHWQTKGQRPVLFMSPNSGFEQGKQFAAAYRLFFRGSGLAPMASRVQPMGSLVRASGK